MAAVVHLCTAAPDDLALAIMRQQLAAGDDVTLVLLGADRPAPPGGDAEPSPGGDVLAPPGVTVRRTPDDLSYDALLEAIFAADHVVAW